MFSFLKKKKKKVEIEVSDEEIVFLRHVFFSLPRKYSFLCTQIDHNIIDHKVINEFNPDGFTFALNENADKFIDHSKSFFSLRGIMIKRTNLDEQVEMRIGILDGVIIYYSLSGCDFSGVDVCNVTLNKMYEYRPSEHLIDQLISLLGKDLFLKVKSKFGINSVYKTDWDGNEYIVFSVDDEGNIYCVDDQGGMFYCTYVPPTKVRIYI